MKKAIFFDRDNTLIYDKGYMYKTEDLKFFPKTFETLKILRDQGFIFFIISNQSGIGRGYFEEKDMHNFHDYMEKQLNKEGIHFGEYLYCPHAPSQNCDCRKPSPKIINEAIERHQIDRSQSYMVGDKKSDVDAGINAGITPIQVFEDKIEDILNKIK